MDKIYPLIAATWTQALRVSTSGAKSDLKQRLAGWADIGTLLCLILFSVSIAFPKVTNLWEVALALGPLFWVSRMALNGEWDLVRTPLDLPLILLVLVGLISLITSLDPAYTLRQLRVEMFKWILLFYFAVFNVKSMARGWILIACLIASALVMDVYTITDFFLNGGSLLAVKYRAPGLHNGSVNLATYLTQTMPLLVLSLIYIKPRSLKLAFGLLAVIHVLALYMTFSRACLGAVIIEMGFILFLMGKSWRIILVWLIGASLALVFLFPNRTIVSDVSPRAAEPLSVGAESSAGQPQSGVEIAGLNVRFALWKQALSHIKQHPFKGIGFGPKMFLRKNFPGLKEGGEHHSNSHNTFLEMALEMGVQGLLVFLFLLYRIFKTLWIRRGALPDWLNTGPAGLIIAGTLIMTVGYFTRNMASQVFSRNAALMFWLLVGASFSLKLHNPGLLEVGSSGGENRGTNEHS